MNHYCQKWISFSIVAAVAIVGFIAVANCTGDNGPKNVQLTLNLPELISFEYWGDNSLQLNQRSPIFYSTGWDRNRVFHIRNLISGYQLGVTMENGGKLVHDAPDAALTTHPIIVDLANYIDYNPPDTIPLGVTDWADDATGEVSHTFVTVDDNVLGYDYYSKYDMNVDLLNDASGLYKGTIIWKLTPPLP
jgi:hypothetical protein